MIFNIIIVLPSLQCNSDYKPHTSYFVCLSKQLISGESDKGVLESMCHLLTYVSDVVAALKASFESNLKFL